MKNYFKIGLGALLLTFGIGAYKYNQFQFEKNIVRLPKVNQLEVIGDSGQKGPILDLVSAYARRAPVMVILGDERYPDGIQNEAQFIEYIKIPFYNGNNIVLFVGGNHTQYAKGNRDFLLKLARSGKYPWFIYPNYYYAVETEKACHVFMDTALYDVKIDLGKTSEVREAQEDFVKKIPSYCEGKQLHIYGHHGIYASDDSHGDRKNDDLKKFYEKYIRGIYVSYTNGHSHLSSMEWCEGKTGFKTRPIFPKTTFNEGYTCHVTVGAASKINKCTRNKNDTCYERPGTATILPNNIVLNLL